MKPQISKDAIDFIRADIDREIRLASLSEHTSYRLLTRIFKLPIGGGNLMCALALLCYTEFFGKELCGGSGGNKFTFECFFEKMGTKYKQLLTTHNIYNIFRCGLAHEYWVKRSGTVFMFGSKSPALGFDKNGEFFFVVEQYYRDLMKAVEAEFDII
jgi:hypothetical protein